MDRRKERKNKLSVKQWICLALVAVMLLGVVPIAAFAEDDGIATIANLSAVTVQAGGSRKEINLSQNIREITSVSVNGISVSKASYGNNSTRAYLSAARTVAAGTYTVTITYTNSNKQTVTDTIVVTVTEASSGGGNWFPGGSNYPLEMRYYDPSSEVYYEVFKLTDSNGKVKGDQNTIKSVTLGGTEVENTQDTAKALSNYYTGISNNATSGALTKDLVITPAEGYYVVEVVIACCSTQFNNDPYQCQTWAYGNAFRAEFTISDSSVADHSVTIKDLHAKNFGHMSYPNSDHYAIAIRVAPIPTPLYVEYNYGDIVANGANAEVFNDADAWTSVGAGNDYGTGSVLTANTQFKYAYAGEASASQAALWKHFVNGITDEAIEAAAAAGYYFAGWHADYFTTVKATEKESNGNNYTLTFEGDYADDTDVAPGAKLPLTTNVKLTAQWKPYKLTVEKVVNGLPSDKTGEYVIEVKRDGQTVETVTFNGTDSKTLEKVVPGEYTIEEIKNQVDGYTVDVKYEPKTVTIGGDVKTATMKVTNTYEKITTGTLSLKKVVEGVDAGDNVFNFTIGNWNVDLKNNEEQSATLNAGTYTITEDAPKTIGNYKWTGVTYTDESGKELTDAEVTVVAGDTVKVIATNTYELMTGSLTIKKEFSGLPEDAETPAVIVTVAGGPNNYSEEFTLNEGNNYQVTISNLPVGTYTVSEDSSSMEEVGYYAWDKVEYTDSNSVTIGDGETKTITAKNFYVQKYTDITVTKKVTGNMGDINKEFAFTVTDAKGEKIDDFKLKDSGRVTLKKLEIGSTITITEESGVYTATYKIGDGEAKATTLDEAKFTSSAEVEVADGMVIAFTNTNDVTIDTGVSLDVIPFVILLAIAGGALVLLNRKRLF